MAKAIPRMQRGPVQLPDAETLLILFDYRPETGALRWRPRPATRPDDRAWNTKYAGREAGHVSARGYRVVDIERATYKVHRVIYKMVTREEPPAQIDHINGDYSDNRIENLRPATPSQNCANKPTQRNSTTGVKGVSFDKRRGLFMARVQLRGHSYYVGLFKTLDAAKAARDSKARQLHGEFFRG